MRLASLLKAQATATSGKPASNEPAPSPSEAVRAAIAAGVSSRSAISAQTGLRRETVDVIIDRLERSGELRREALGGVCSGGGCASCEHSSGGACAGSVIKNTGPVALVLTRRPGVL